MTKHNDEKNIGDVEHSLVNVAMMNLPKLPMIGQEYEKKCHETYQATAIQLAGDISMLLRVVSA